MAVMEMWEPPEPRRRREVPGPEADERVWLQGDPDGSDWTTREADRRHAAARDAALPRQGATAARQPASNREPSRAAARPDPAARHDPALRSHLAAVPVSPERRPGQPARREPTPRRTPAPRRTPVSARAASPDGHVVDLGDYLNRRRRPMARVPDGPLAYRHRVRWYGPLLALVPPAAALLVAAYAASTTEATTKGLMLKGAVVFILTLCALPTALLAGIPWNGGGGRYFLAVASSIVVWLVVGAAAGRLATRSAVASWRDWWREYGLLVAGLWGGVLVALGIVAVALGVVG